MLNEYLSDGLVDERWVTDPAAQSFLLAAETLHPFLAFFLFSSFHKCKCLSFSAAASPDHETDLRVEEGERKKSIHVSCCKERSDQLNERKGSLTT